MQDGLNLTLWCSHAVAAEARMSGSQTEVERAVVLRSGQGLFLAADVFAHISSGLDGSTFFNQRTRPVDASVHAKVDFHHHMVEVLDVFQSLDALLRAVDGDVFVAFGQHREGVDDALRYRVFLGKVGRAVFLVEAEICDFVEFDVPFLEECHNILEGQHVVNQMTFIGFTFLGDAGTDKDDSSLWVLLLDDFGMGHHWRVNGGKVFECLRIVFLNHAACSRAGRGDEIGELARLEQARIFFGNGLCANGGFFRIGKA